jgi:preprotein translocase subunit SecA
MAGRGVDIVLGGETPNKFERNTEDDSEKTRKKMEQAYEDAKKQWQKQHDEVVAAGGLYVIGTERHESRRIDNQLRGRAGRQGDPGTTRFFVSLEDDMMRIFGGEQVAKMMDFFKLPEDQPLEHMMVSKALEQAQTKVEGHNFDIRKHLVEYDDVLNKQRDILYKMRQTILFATPENPEALENEVERAFKEQVETLLNMYVFVEAEPDFDKFAEELDVIMPASADKLIETIQTSVTGREEAADMALEMFKKLFAKRKKEVGAEVWTQVVKFVFLDISDKLWTDHLTAIEDLRQGINLRGYAQLDPLTEYKNEAFSMFEKLLNDVSFDFIRRIFQIKVTDESAVNEKMKTSAAEEAVYSAPSPINVFEQVKTQTTASQIEEAEIIEPVHEHNHKHNQDHEEHNHEGHDHNHDESTQQIEGGVGYRVTPPGQASKKPNRNDPCWCGSGKKYKKCHYPN